MLSIPPYFNKTDQSGCEVPLATSSYDPLKNVLVPQILADNSAFFKSAAVSFILSAASLARLLSFQRILEKSFRRKDGKYTAFSIIHTICYCKRERTAASTLSNQMERIGVFKDDISKRFLAIASPWPCSSV